MGQRKREIKKKKKRTTETGMAEEGTKKIRNEGRGIQEEGREGIERKPFEELSMFTRTDVNPASKFQPFTLSL